MSDTTTNWILKLIDKISAPAKSVEKSIKGITDQIEDTTEAVQFNEKETKQALANTKKWYKDVNREIQNTEKELKELKQAYKDASPGKNKAIAGKAFEEATERLKKLRKQLQAAEADMDHLNNSMEEFGKKKQAWTDIATGINQTIEVVDRLGDSLSFTADINDARVEIQRMTDLSGEALDQAAAKAHKLGKVYNENSVEIAKAANVITKELGGSFDSNLAIIEAGFKKGANINGDMIDQLKEYPAQIREMGMPLETYFAIMAKSGKDGVFSDKAIDALKEGGLALREMDEAQEEALKGIGLKTADLVGKTTWEAMQVVIENMEKSNVKVKDRQKVLADIFKGAGEDAGRGFFQGIAKGVPKLEDIPEVEQAGAGLKGFVADIEIFVAKSTGNLGIYISEASNLGTQIIGLVGVFNLLKTSIIGTTIAQKASLVWTKLVTGAQWLWNAAMAANPIGLVVAAIVALIAYIGIAINYYDQFGAAMLMLLGPIGYLINAFKAIYDHWDSIVKAFKDGGILAGLKRIGIVLLDAVLKPLQQILSLIAKIDPTGLAEKGLKAIKSFREQNNLVTDGEKKTEDKKNKKQESEEVIADATTSPTVLDFVAPKKKEKKSKKSAVGTSSNSSGSNTTSIKMTINNYFKVGKSVDINRVASKVATKISDRLQDAIVTT